jgi:hypothetical protein
MKFKKEYSIQDILLLLNLIVLAVSAWFVVKQLRLSAEEFRVSSEQLRQNRLSQETMIELERRKAALAFIARWNDPQMIDLRAKALHAPEGEAERHHVQAYLNFFEEMALAVLNRAANADICMRYFRNMLFATYSHFKDVIEGGPGYPHLKQLRAEWQKAPDTLPPLSFEQDSPPTP